ncbi:cell growth-regulating nucleolar protein [Mastacembelus armatus]|uniref:Cell growth-regulating nucleolar protein n=1 Tax=Mastacembelus armatus TaxID=205130 RepID=A0A7N8WSP4_9TELE|nr:cell growth-regulating nucleolar protein [Mastacembelus armatus]
MVFFTCNGCGESLKKVQVDKHVNICRSCQVLSCIDCGKDFWGDDYKNHNRCISEDQKYGGKSYEAKANKGDVKQQQWIQKINEAMSKPGVSAKLKDVLRQVSSYDNVPRKKAKFQNWIRNSLKIANTSLQDEVWDILAAADDTPEPPQQNTEDKQKMPEAQVQAHGNEKQNGQTKAEKKMNKHKRKEAHQHKNGKATKDVETAVVQEPEPEKDQAGKKKKKDRKRKHGCEEEGDEEQSGSSTSSKKTKTDETAEAADTHMSEETENQVISKGKFNWKGNIKAVLRDSPDQELSVKKLRKKVLAAYYSFTGEGNFKTEEEVLALFNKKIGSNPTFRVLKDRVRLVK